MNVVRLDNNPPATRDDALKQSEAISRALRRAARKVGAPVSIISGGARIGGRRDRAFRLAFLISFVLMVVLPFAVETIYWGVIVSEQFATEVKFAVRAQSGRAPSETTSSGLMSALSAAPQSQDTQIVANYIQSRGLVDALNSALDLRRIYGRKDVDYFSRFDPDDSVEELQKYWRARVDASVETLSGIITVNVRAFTPADSLALAERIVDLSEALVNDLSTRSRRDALALAQMELTRAEAALRKATDAMRDTRDASGVLDAGASAEAITKIITSLRLEMSRAEQDYATLGRATRDSPQARILLARIASLKAQIDEYSSQIAGISRQKGGVSIATGAGELSRAQIEVDIAHQRYGRAVAALERARSELEAQQAYLVSILKPALAQKSTYPRRLWEWTIILVPCLLGWALLAAVAFMVRDHMAK